MSRPLEAAPSGSTVGAALTPRATSGSRRYENRTASSLVCKRSNGRAAEPNIRQAAGCFLGRRSLGGRAPMRCLPPTSVETGPRADRRALVEVEKSRVAVRTSFSPKSRKSIAQHFNVSNRNHLFDLSSEEEIERPADHHSELLSKPRKLRQVDHPPQPPRDESRKRYPAHPGHASPPPDAGQKPHRSVPERLQRTPNHCTLDVPRGCHAFPQTVLCGRRVPSLSGLSR
jgi:hypothetical protein